MAGSSASFHCVKKEQNRSSNMSAPAAPSEKKKRNQPGNPSPNAEVVALSPQTLLATNRFICEVCNKGFQREQNLQLHRRGHNLPWKLKQKASQDVARKVYLCPEPGCVHHDPARALGDLSGIKKHFSRKHCEKRFTCEKCNKKYALHSDCKAHSKQCGSKAYKCDCGTTFSRRDSFVSHRAYCEALAQDTARHSLSSIATMYANASSAAIPTLGSTAPLMSADYQEPVSHPVLGAPAAAFRPSFTDLLSGHSVGSSLIRPIDQQMIVQPPEPKLSFQFSELQGINHNTAPTGPMFSWESPVQNYEDDNNLGLFTGLMMDADVGVFGNGIGAGVGAGAGGGTYHNMHSTINTDATDEKLTRDFLGVGGKMRNFTGGMEDDEKGNGTELKAPDSEATTSAKAKLPFGGYRPDV